MEIVQRIQKNICWSTHSLNNVRENPSIQVGVRDGQNVCCRNYSWLNIYSQNNAR